MTDIELKKCRSIVRMSVSFTFLVKFEAEQLCPIKLSQFQHGGYHNEYNIGICRMNCY